LINLTRGIKQHIKSWHGFLSPMSIFQKSLYNLKDVTKLPLTWLS